MSESNDAGQEDNAGQEDQTSPKHALRRGLLGRRLDAKASAAALVARYKASSDR